MKKRILIVDDEVKFTRLVKSYLEQTNLYEVREEHRGLDALQTAQAFQPDLILLDVLIPDQDGTQVAAQLKAHKQLKRIPIIFLTVVVSQEEVEALNGVIGGYPFLAKPLKLEGLMESVERYLGAPPSRADQRVRPTRRPPDTRRAR